MNKSTKTKLIATIISVVCAISLLAVGVMASLTNFQVAIANQLNLKFDTVEGTLYATRVGDVAGIDRTTSKVLSESTTATDWLKVYDGTTTEGVQNDALTSIQEKVDFISNDAIKAKVNAGTTSIAITYYFYYTLPTNAVSNDVVLTAPAVADGNVAVTYSYVKGTGATLPDFTSGTVLTNGETVQVAGGEHLFIKAEAKVDLSKSVKIENANWNFTLNFGISKYTLTGDTLNFKAVSGAETYEVWAKETTTSGASLLAQTSAVGDTDATLGTLKKILNKDTTSLDLKSALAGLNSGDYLITVLPKNASGVEITGNRVATKYTFESTITITFVFKDLNGYGNYSSQGFKKIGSNGTALSNNAITVEAGLTWKQIVAKLSLQLYYANDSFSWANASAHWVSATATSITYTKSGGTSQTDPLTEYYNGLNMDAVISSNTTITLTYKSWMCLTSETDILVYDEKKKKYVTKKIKDITYNDLVACWDFDNGKLTYAKPVWISKSYKAEKVTRVTYSDGTVLDVCGNHSLLSVEDGAFVHEVSKYKLGTTNYKANGEFVTITKIETINKTVQTNSIITNYHMNCFANGVLTSVPYNNLYPIKDMKFVKDDRKLRKFEEYDVPREFYDGFRLGEVQYRSIDTINKSIKDTFIKPMLPKE